MAKHYVLFIHGVGTRSVGPQLTYANTLIDLIKKTTPIEPLVVYWGSVNDREEENLLNRYRTSGI